jgi:hypothetical protein
LLLLCIRPEPSSDADSADSWPVQLVRLTMTLGDMEGEGGVFLGGVHVSAKCCWRAEAGHGAMVTRAIMAFYTQMPHPQQ